MRFFPKGFGLISLLCIAPTLMAPTCNIEVSGTVGVERVDTSDTGTFTGTGDTGLVVTTPVETGDTGLPTDTGSTDDTAEPCVAIAEVCDGLDNDCDGAADNDLEPVLYADADGDGFGDVVALQEFACDADTTGFVADATDCDDLNATANPDAVEDDSNLVDDDCDGDVDECEVGMSRLDSYVFDATGFTATDVIVRTQRYDVTGMQVYGGDLSLGAMTTIVDGVDGFSISTVGSITTISHSDCVDDVETWYFTVEYTDAASAQHWQCEGDGVAFGIVENGTRSVTFDGVTGVVTCVNNYEQGLNAFGTPLFPNGKGTGSEDQLED